MLLLARYTRSAAIDSFSIHNMTAKTSCLYLDIAAFQDFKVFLPLPAHACEDFATVFAIEKPKKASLSFALVLSIA